MVKRILFTIILLFSILFMPFWISIILALIGMVIFSIFWEAVIIFLLTDLLYGVKEARFFNIFFIYFLASILVLIALELIKKKLKFYANNK